MTMGLVRYQQSGCFHFLTFSCYRRLPYLGTTAARSLFERSLEAMRIRYGFGVCGYVVMPEHVHLLVSEPKKASLSKAIQALKLSVSVQCRKGPFWQARYYDFNVHNEEKWWRNFATCIVIQSSAGWSRSRNNGNGPASGTTRREKSAPWRSSPSGPERGGKACAIPGLIVETWGTHNRW